MKINFGKMYVHGINKHTSKQGKQTNKQSLNWHELSPPGWHLESVDVPPPVGEDVAQPVIRAYKNVCVGHKEV